MSYIFKQKYVVVGYYQYSPDYFVQMSYQAPDSLLNIFQVNNMNYQQIFGGSFIIPFKAGKVLDSKLTLNFFRTVNKDDNFFGLSYKRSTGTFDVHLQNTIPTSTHPLIAVDLSGYYAYKRIQGIYNIKSSGNLSPGIKITTNNNRADLIIRANDVLDTNVPSTVIHYGLQNSKAHYFQDTR